MTESTEREIIHRELETNEENPAARIAEIVADLEDKDHANLATMYECVDHVIDDLFSTPPAPESQIEVAFSYEGYRITLEQNGTLTLMNTETRRE